MENFEAQTAEDEKIIYFKDLFVTWR